MRHLAIALLSLSCSRRPPALPSNHEPPPAPTPMVCQSLLVKPAMFCIGSALLFFDGCRWTCVRASTLRN